MRFEVDYSMGETARLLNIKKYVIAGSKSVCLSISAKPGKTMEAFIQQPETATTWQQSQAHLVLVRVYICKITKRIITS